MIAHVTKLILVAVALTALTACNPARVSVPETSSAQPDIVPIAVPESETVEAPVAQTLVYEWDTEFSAFLSPPVEIRHMARDDCIDAGYEVAVVETMALEGNMARATYICRGDFE